MTRMIVTAGPWAGLAGEVTCVQPHFAGGAVWVRLDGEPYDLRFRAEDLAAEAAPATGTRQGALL